MVKKYLSLLSKLVGMDRIILTKAINEAVDGGSGTDSYTKEETDSLLDLKTDITTTDALEQEVSTNTTDIATLQAIKPILTINNTTPDENGNYNISSSGSTAEDIPLSSTDETTVAEELITLQSNIDTKANSSDVYLKTEVDTLLDDKVDDSELNNYYLKTEVDTLLDDKADTSVTDSLSSQLTTLDSEVVKGMITVDPETPLLPDENGYINPNSGDIPYFSDDLTLSLKTVLDTKATVGDSYKKAEEDALLATKANQTDLDTTNSNVTALTTTVDTKANSSDVYLKTQTYSQTEVNNLISAIKGYGLFNTSIATPTAYPTNVTQLTYQNTKYIDNSTFSISNNNLVVAKTGVYRVAYTVQLRGTLATAGITTVTFQLNGASYYTFSMLSPTTLLGGSFAEFFAGCDMIVTAGDSITISTRTGASGLQWGDNGATKAYHISAVKVA